MFKERFKSESPDQYRSYSQLEDELHLTYDGVRKAVTRGCEKIKKKLQLEITNNTESEEQFKEYHEQLTRLWKNPPPAFQEWLEERGIVPPKGQLVFIISGSMSDEDTNREMLELMVEELQQSGIASLRLKAVRDGSIKLFLEGDNEDLRRLKELFDSGKLKKIRGYSVEEVRDLSKEEDKDINKLIKRDSKISSYNWTRLFEPLPDIVLADTIAACRHAFCAVLGLSIYDHRPKLNQLKTLADVKNILSKEDNPEIAVQFANAIAEQYATGSIRDNVIVWRDRLAQQHDITVTAPEPLESQQSMAAYLLITLQPSGYGDRDVWLGASLHLEEAEGIVSDIVPIEINAEKSPCSLDQVPEYLPKFITRAEQHLLELKVYQPLTLELFLPYNSLDHRVDAWEIKEQLDGEATTLGREYPVVVRSLDRFDRTRKPKLLLELGKRWNLLQEVVRNSMILQSFYSLNNHEIDKLDYQNLKLVLEERVGLKCSSQLPTDESDRRQLFKCILASGIPVTMWLYVPQAEPEETLEAFDRLLTAQNLSDFYSFAQQIRRVRCTPQHPLQHMGLLWDCPHRTPLMPSTQDPLKMPQK